VALNICGPSIWNLVHVSFLEPRTLRGLLHFWKICGPLIYTHYKMVHKFFQKSTSHLKILGIRRATRTKFHTRTHKYQVPPYKRLVATTTWRPGFVYYCITSCLYWPRTQMLFSTRLRSLLWKLLQFTALNCYIVSRSETVSSHNRTEKAYTLMYRPNQRSR